MKDLKKLLNSKLSVADKYDYRSALQHDIFEKVIIDFTDNNICKLYEQYNGDVDAFFESLISHDTNTLQRKLEENFSNYFDAFIDIDRPDADNKFGFAIKLKNNITRNTLKSDIKFINLLKFFNFYLGYYDKSINAVAILPIYPNEIDADKYLNLYSLYHFTYKDFGKNILKSGLRTKSSISDMPERIYLYMPNDGKSIKYNDIKNFIEKVLDVKQIKKRGLCIIKFDYYKYCNDYKHAYTLYKDAGMNEPEAVYGLLPIPSKYLKEINI